MLPTRSRRSLGDSQLPPVVDRIVLLCGFFGLLGAILLTYVSPADGYEVSIYASTPIGVWVGLAIAYLATVVVTLRDTKGGFSRLALVLGGLATFVIVALPVLRGYRYYGHHDALTHLGWSRELAAGDRAFFELFYPAGHTMSVFYADTFGLSIEHGAMLMVATFLGLFLLFVPFVVRTMTRDRRATAIAAFSGFLLLSVTNVSGGVMFHTFSLGVFFFPLVLFVLLRTIIEPEPKRIGPVKVSNNTLWTVLAGSTLVFVHPQVALNLIILVFAILVLYLVYRRLQASTLLEGLDDRERPTIRPPYVAFAVIGLVWVLWITQFGHVFVVGQRVLFAVEDLLLGTGEIGRTVEDQGASADAIGISLVELFVKLFLISSLYTVAAALVVLVSLWSRVTTEFTRTVVVYFGLAGGVMIPFFLAHFLGDVSHLFFRHVGFAMVFATVLGAIGLFWISSILLGRFRPVPVRTIGLFLAAIALTMSLVVVYPSPYIAQQNHHVSSYEYEGYDLAFEHHDEAIGFSGIRQSPDRYVDAIGDDRNIATVGPVFEEDLRENPAATRGDAFYLPVTKSDRDRETIAYRELRYSDRAMTELADTPHVHRIQANDEFTLYYVDGERLDGNQTAG